MSNDDPKKAILARRKRFVAAAIASVGIAGCGSSTDSTTTPQACLKAAPDTGEVGDTGDADTYVEPEACLSAPFDSGTPETSPDAKVDSDSETGKD